MSSFLFFIVPMTVICVLYVLIGLKLRQSKLLYGKKMKTCDSQRCIKGQSRVVRMLGESSQDYQWTLNSHRFSFAVAVVVTFFLCWAPFHAQRIMAIYGKIMDKSFQSDDLFMRVYVALTYISGISYFLSTCINPFLYNIMSHKFRNASKVSAADGLSWESSRTLLSKLMAIINTNDDHAKCGSHRIELLLTPTRWVAAKRALTFCEPKDQHWSFPNFD